MPKDATRNIDRYKIRGGHLNDFDFHRNHGAVSQQEQGDWPAGQSTASDLPPDQAKGERVRQLLAEYGEAVPEPVEKVTPIRTGKAEQSSDQQNKSELSFSENVSESVPDVAAGRLGASPRREKASLPANASAKPARSRPTTRKENKVIVKPKKVQAEASGESNKSAPVRSASTQKNTTKAAAKPSEPQSATRKSVKRTAATESKQSTPHKSAKKATTARSEQQPTVHKSTKKVAARKTISKS